MVAAGATFTPPTATSAQPPDPGLKWIEKDLLRPGRYKTADGKTWTYTLQDLHAFASNFALRWGRGQPCPLTVDHSPSALDVVEKDVDRMWVDGDVLKFGAYVTPDVAALCDRVGYVSGEFASSCTDGDGRKYGPTVRAVTLCQSPILGGQQPFKIADTPEQLAAMSAVHARTTRVTGTFAGVACFSLANYGGPPMDKFMQEVAECSGMPVTDEATGLAAMAKIKARLSKMADVPADDAIDDDLAALSGQAWSGVQATALMSKLANAIKGAVDAAVKPLQAELATIKGDVAKFSAAPNPQGQPNTTPPAGLRGNPAAPVALFSKVNVTATPAPESNAAQVAQFSRMLAQRKENPEEYEISPAFFAAAN